MSYNCECKARTGLNMSLKYNRFLPLCLAILSVFSVNNIALAQIVPDNTLPQNSVATPNGDTIEITGGTTRGNNLFHSFEQFSVLVNESTFFDNATTIENIIGRVTGGSISEIDGLIRANGTANLFLINPNGIIFGENAALDIGGSSIGSTANSINFADGTEFSAVNPNASLLTVSIPAGLQYGRDNGDISVRGTGNNLFIDFDTFTVDRSDRPVGLEVDSDKTLALIGRNVFLEGGNLTASQGNIEVGSVGEGIVSLTPDEMGWKLGYEDINAFQDISLSQAASIEASGNSGGRVKLKGGFVSLLNGSAILADTQGDGTGGLLTIEAADIEIDGEADNGFTSSLFVNVDLGATGDGGDLLIDTGYFYVGGGAQVNVNTFGLGNAGTLTVKAREIELYSVSSDESLFSGLYAQADIGETGKGGKIDVETNSLLLDDSAQINSNTFGDGDAGNIKIQAQDIQLLGSFGFGSLLSASADVDSTGNGGNLEVNTDTLYVAESSQINVSTFGEGDGGNLIINTNEIELNGTVDEFSSGLFASSEFEATGNGGNLEINTDKLLITDGAQAIAATFGEGNGGNLIVNANKIELSGTSEEGDPSGLFTAAQIDSTGNGGDLQIRTNQLNINDSAQIAVSTSGSGDAGDLNIVAQNINITGSNEFGPSSILANAFIDEGNGGEIAIATDNLSLQDGATISASNFFSADGDVPPGEGMAGNITIDANTIELDSTGDRSSSITTSTNAQSGGNITLNSGSLMVNNGSRVTAESEGVGDGGSINISANKVDLNIQGQVSVNSTGLGQAGDITVAANSLNLNEGAITATSTQSGGGEIDLFTDSIALNNNSLISTSVLDSTGGGGNIFIDNGEFIIGDNSDIKADAVFGQGGNIQITAKGIFFDVDSEITASSEFGVDGVVEINDLEANKLDTISLPERINIAEAVIVSSCPVASENTFTVTKSGGLPENPRSYLRGRTIWQDTRQLVGSDSNENSQPNTLKSNLNRTPEINTIVESQAWIVNSRGNVELVAAAPKVSPKSFWHRGISCGDL